jgi:glycosyltransferase involved in cell wall biosynthesis
MFSIMDAHVHSIPEIVVCEFADYAPPFMGNFIASLFNLEKRLEMQNSNNKMLYIFYENAKKCEWANEMVSSGKKIFFLKNKKISILFELTKILKNNNVNILHLHFVPTIPCIMTVLYLKMICPRIKIIIHFRNTFSGLRTTTSRCNAIKSKLKQYLYRMVSKLNTVVKLCGVSEAVFDDLIANGIDIKKCMFIDNGIVFSRLDCKSENGKEIYGIKDKNVLMIMGTHFYRKGVDIAINAIKDIAEKHNIVLMIVCIDDNTVSEEIKKILTYVPDWIIIVQVREDIDFYFKMSDIYLAPSREEGFLNATLESIYCGTPYIRSDIPQINRNMPNENIVPVNDTIALQKAIELVLTQNPENKQQILKEQKEFILSRWNIDIWNSKVIDMYLDTVNEFTKIVVCEFANYAPPFAGNFIASLFNLENELKKQNSNNKMLYIFYESAKKYEWAKEMISNDKEIFFLRNKKISVLFQLTKILRNNNVNILHLHFVSVIPFIAILICLRMICPKTKVIIHFHNTLTGLSGETIKFNTIKSKLKRYLYKTISKLNVVTKFCGVGKAVFDDLIVNGIDRKKCMFIDNGIVFSRLDGKSENGKEIYDMKDKKVLMIIGTHFYRKGVDIAINAVKDIAKKHNIVLMIVCIDGSAVSQEIKKILTYIPDWIIIVQVREDIDFYFKMSDIYLTPSREEGFSYAMLESIYCGTPYIRSNLPAMDRNIHYENIIPINDVVALQKSIEFVLAQDIESKRQILKEQKEFVLSLWNIDTWSSKVIDMYLDIVSK